MILPHIIIGTPSLNDSATMGEDGSEKKMNIAVIGSGLTGLTAAYCLGEHHAVHLYERHNEVGMDAYGCDLELSDGQKCRVDVPLRVISPGYYLNLTSFYKEVGIGLKQEHYSFSFSDMVMRDAKQSFVSDTYWSNLNWFLFNKVFPTPSLSSLLYPSSWRVSLHFLKLLVLAKQDCENDKFEKMTFKDWLKFRNFSESVIFEFVFPLVSGILTCDFDQVGGYPAGILLQYMASGMGEGVYRATGGSRTVCQRLTRRCEKVHLNAKVKEVRSVYHQGSDKIDYVELVHENGTTEVYDRVVIATQANQAHRLLKSSSSHIRKALEEFTYSSTNIVCHTDPRVMPKERKHWKVINFCVDVKRESQRSMITIYMNALLPELKNERDIFQTLNPTVRPKEESVLEENWLDRPVFTPSTLEAVDTIKQCQGEGGVYICGSYVVHGVPLLEGAVTSACEVAQQLGVTPSFLDQRAPAASGAKVDTDGSMSCQEDKIGMKRLAAVSVVLGGTICCYLLKHPIK